MCRIGTKNYRISWEHDYQKKTLTFENQGKIYKVKNKKKSRTICYLKDENHKVIFQGEATCFPGATMDMWPSSIEEISADNYSKEIGRKISLTRALETLPFEERKEAWDSYNSRKERLAEQVRKNIALVV